MPFVHIRITPDGATPDKKNELIAGVTDVLHKVLGKDPSITWVVVEEVAHENWGVGGVSLAERRRRAEAG